MAVGEAPIIIKKVKKGHGHGHHGGAWKVAYADFVTAMMAFFLLMWLINTTSPEQKRGIADYFAPASVSETTSGSGGILGGTALGEDGAKQSGSMSVIEDMSPETPSPEDASSSSAKTAEDAMKEAQAKREAAAFASAAESLRQALQDMPEITEQSKNIIVEETKEGLNISLVDQDGRAMFPDGAREPYERTRRILATIAPILRRLPNRIAVSGHTSAQNPGTRPGWTAWDLSAARAGAVREILAASGIPDHRFASISGKGDTEPMFPDNPYLAANRRVTITLLREAPPLPIGKRF